MSLPQKMSAAIKTGRPSLEKPSVQGQPSSHIAIFMPKAPYCSLSKCTYWVSTGVSPTSLSYQPREPHPHDIEGSCPENEKQSKKK